MKCKPLEKVLQNTEISHVSGSKCQHQNLYYLLGIKHKVNLNLTPILGQNYSTSKVLLTFRKQRGGATPERHVFFHPIFFNCSIFSYI